MSLDVPDLQAILGETSFHKRQKTLDESQELSDFLDQCHEERKTERSDLADRIEENIQ